MAPRCFPGSIPVSQRSKRERRRLPWNPASAPRLPETLARRSRLSRVWRGADMSPLIKLPPGLASEALQIHPAWKLQIFCVYPLGIMRERSYHGGLSFSAKMQIEAEDGV